MNHSGLNRFIGSTVMPLVILCLLPVSFGYAETIYVDSGATGADDGTSWNDSYVDLQPAIDAAASGDEIWVAAGTYYATSWPNGGNEERAKHFSLKNDMSIYGGFAGTETSLEDRDVGINETIVSGDIGTEGDDSDNCYHVFYHPEGTDLDTTAVLDGFTLAGGNADGSMSHHHSGGGMYNYSSSPTLINCIFSDNSASYATSDFEGNTYYHGYASGMYNRDSSPTLTNCTFSENSVSSSVYVNALFYWGYGGGMGNASSSHTLNNCTFSNNFSEDGGGICNSSSSPALINCILWGNDAQDSGNQVRNYESTPVFSYCDIEGSIDEGVYDEELETDGGNNIDSDPLFIRNPGTDSEDDPGDLHLTSDSPCIDAGDPSITGGQDMDGETRVFDGDEDGIAIVDIGADEYVDLDYDGIADRVDAFPNDPDNMTDTDDSDDDSGGSSGGGSSGGCFTKTLFGAGK